MSNDELYAVYLGQADSAKSAEQNGSDKEKKEQLNQPQNNNEQSTKATDVDKCEVGNLIPSTSEHNDVKNVDSGKKKKKSKKQNKPQSNNKQSGSGKKKKKKKSKNQNSHNDYYDDDYGYNTHRDYNDHYDYDDYDDYNDHHYDYDDYRDDYSDSHDDYIY